jgi:PIN domain nuclease of toxin-antitoxin system
VAAVIYLDTHVVAWLYAGRDDLLSDRVLELLETEGLMVSPMVGLELTYLHEVGKTTRTGKVIIQDLQERLGVRVCDWPFGAVILSAMEQSWTREPFDRVIVGHAAAAGRPLVTKDRSIHQHYRAAVW